MVDDARTAEIRARARATVARLNAEANDPAHIAYMERIRRQADQDRRNQMVDDAVARARGSQIPNGIDGATSSEASMPSLAAPPSYTRRSVNTTWSEAQELCRKAWDAPYVKGSPGDTPSLMGVCRHKALWLQQRLGGVVCSGWKAGEGHHAVLLLPIDGTLYIADHGKVVPLHDYDFHFDGMYERDR